MLAFVTWNLLPLVGAGFLFAEEVRPKDLLIVETLTLLKRFDVSETKMKASVERFARTQRGEEGYFELWIASSRPSCRTAPPD